MNIIKIMSEGVTTAVKFRDGESKEFEVKVGVHQGSVLSPLLFIVLEALSTFKVGLPWELFCADDLALIAESEESFEKKSTFEKRRWKRKGSG